VKENDEIVEAINKITEH